ncbi:hypothetical protein [Denitrovibrio acetiphilus]|nr:hypothetical protein [Denitrovibrio acetiphilus]
MFINILLLTACQVYIGVSNDEDDDDTKHPSITYAKGDGIVSGVTDSDGRLNVHSEDSDIDFELTVTDKGGEDVSGIKVSYFEDGGVSVIYVSDPYEDFADAVLAGTPLEISHSVKKADIYKVVVTIGEYKDSSDEFTDDSYNVSAFLGDAGTTDAWDAKCGSFADVISFFEDIYDADLKRTSSILSFSSDKVSDVKYPARYHENLDDYFEDALMDRVERAFGGYSNQLIRLVCFSPDTTGLFSSLCQISYTASCSGSLSESSAD